MSEIRSATPSDSATCHLDVRLRNCSARAFACSNSAISRGVSSGCKIALSSDRIDTVICSVTNVRSWTALRTLIDSALASTSLRRWATNEGNPDSVFSSRLCSEAANSRRSLDTGNKGISPTSRRCLLSMRSISRQSV